MLNLFAETYNYSSPNEGSSIFGLLIFALAIPLLLLVIVSMWKVFEKAGEAGWKAIIPVYNSWVLAEIAGKPGWWGLAGFLGVIPFVGWIGALIVQLIVSIELAKSFGKSPALGVLTMIIPIVGFPILAFGPAKYVGKKFKTIS